MRRGRIISCRTPLYCPAGSTTLRVLTTWKPTADNGTDDTNWGVPFGRQGRNMSIWKVFVSVAKFLGVGPWTYQTI
jgi:hypothetical protein